MMHSFINPRSILIAAVALMLMSCGGGEISIKEGPNLKEVLDEKQAERLASEARQSLITNIDNCDSNSDLLKSSLTGALQLKIEEIAPLPQTNALQIEKSNQTRRKAVTISGQVLSGAQISNVLADIFNPQENSSKELSNLDTSFSRLGTLRLTHSDLDRAAIVIRSKCLNVEPQTVLKSFGHDLYITADKVSLNGSIQTARLSKGVGGELKIVALKFDYSDDAQISTGFVNREEILNQIKSQATKGQSPVIAIDIAQLNSDIYRARDGMRVERKPGRRSYFDSDETLSIEERINRDAQKIIETFYTLQSEVNPMSASGLLAWNMNRDLFNQWVQQGQFSSVFTKASNAEDWKRELQHLKKNISRGVFVDPTKIVREGYGETDGMTDVTLVERATEEQIQPFIDFELQGMGAIDIIYALGSRASDVKSWIKQRDLGLILSNKDQLFYFLGTAEPAVKITRTLVTEVTLQTSVNPPQSFSKEYVEEVSIPKIVEIRNIRTRIPTVTQSIEDYQRAFREIGLVESSQLDERVVSQLKLLMTKGR